MSFSVVIVGRPNVGKSTLFNKLAGKKLAIVNDQPGVTRDWRAAEGSLGDLSFEIIDTAGFEDADPHSIEGRMRRQTEKALEQADVVLMMVDARAGVTQMDHHFGDLVRNLNIPVYLLANKCDTRKAQDQIYETYELGLGDPVELSAEHGMGFVVLYELLAQHAPNDAFHTEDDDQNGDDGENDELEEGSEVRLPQLDWNKPVHVAIVGRPNAGKSTLVNALLGEERMLTGPEPGITRDAIHIHWQHDDVQYRLVDTAGMRKRPKVQETLEKLSVQEALRAIRLAHVVVLMTDAHSPMDKQDLQIADLVIREGRALVIAVNKWDTVDDKAEKLADIEYILSKSLNQVKNVPIVTISALKGQRLGKLMDAVKNIYTTWNIRVSTGKLNRWLDTATQRKPSPLVNGKSNRLRYITQIKTRPPTFAVWAARPKDLPDSYKRYLINSLRDDFDIPGVPIRLIIKTSKNPFV